MTEALIVRFDERFAPKIRRIRNNVFTEEQEIYETIDFDGQDPDAVHVLVACDMEFVGTGRMLQDGHVGRLAVVRAFRGRGLGASAVLALVEKARSVGLKRVYLGSQMHAVGFYERLGFSQYGKPYTEAGIEHIHMERLI